MSPFRGLTLVSAPPGFGKTTVVAEWLQGIEQPFGWLSLDEDDNDLVRFFAYLIAALQNIDPSIGRAVLARLQEPLPPVETLIALLVNDLAVMNQDAVLVLDDYQNIYLEAVHQALALFVSSKPANIHVLLLTRQDPPLPLAKMRANGELVEIREADLRFSKPEATTFFKLRLKLDLSAEAVESLDERLEGWAAGLQMAELAIQAHLSPINPGDVEVFIQKFRGDDRYVIDYLMDEVISHQPGEIREFLLNTSILERLHAPLCDRLVGEQRITAELDPKVAWGSSNSILEHLERANLFLAPLDNKREWYRYHHLFADLLRYRLQIEHPERPPELHRCASGWHAEHGDASEAMKHALAIPDYPLVADLAEQFMLQMTGSSQLNTYLSWIRRLPDELVFQRAYLCAGCAWVYILTQQLKIAERYIEAGEAALPRYERIYSAPDKRWISSDEVRGNLIAIRSFADRLRGDLPAAINHAQHALKTLPEEALAVRCSAALNLGMLRMDCGELEAARQALVQAYEIAQKSGENVYVAISALSLLGGLATSQGKLGEAERYFQRAIAYGSEKASQAVPIPSLGILHGWMVLLHYHRNKLRLAQEHMEILLASAEQFGVPEVLIRAWLYQALLHQGNGDFASAEVWLQRAEELMQQHPPQALVQAEWILFRGDQFLRGGELDKTERLLETQAVRQEDLGNPPPPISDEYRQLLARLGAYIHLGRLRLSQGKTDQASLIFDRVIALAETGYYFNILLEALVYQALAMSSMKKRMAPAKSGVAPAMEVLERALSLAAPEGYLQVFLNAGAALTNLLRQAIALGIQPGFAQRLLERLKEQEIRQIHVPYPHLAPASQKTVEQLTERERQILRLLAAGLTSTQAANELVISTSTARTYIKNLYQKLDAHSRGEAIDKARELGVL